VTARFFLDHQLWHLYERVHDALTELDDAITDPTQEDS
jgi:hypothetical protein